MSRVRVGVCREFRCESCGSSWEAFCKVEDLTKSIPCAMCQGSATVTDKGSRSYWKPFTPYHHHQLDQVFHTRSDEKAYAKKNGLVNISGDFKGRLSERMSPKESATARYLKKRSMQFR